ncbi:EAL domain-containing protein [Colwellia sp. UCD-KL20]|uniref:sensor domain-containing phosphodiesterase n=1 Tax=Colwellia sp. UCD-KL20 TaxID=1917165 RepID=UPI0009713CF8|nr:EAL domain-containing protein [Colwellia sp. UCD-KL20]
MHPRSIKEYLLLSSSSSGIIVIIVFMLVRLYQQEWMHALLDGVIVLALSGTFYYVYKTRNTEKVSIFLGISSMLGVVLIIWLKGIGHIYWEYPVIIASYYLFRVNVALVLSALLMIVVSILTFEQTSLISFSTIIVTLIMANIFAYFSARNISQQHISLIKSERLERLRNKTLELIVGSHKLPVVLEFITKSVEQENSDVICSISLFDKSKKFLITGAAPSLPKAMIEKMHMVEIGPEGCPCGAAAFYEKRIIVANICTDNRWTLFAELAENSNLSACWAEPIVSSEGEVIGVFSIYHSVHYTPTLQDFLLVEQFAHLASISIEREKNHLLIWQQANFDSLTGLPNRNMMRSHLTQLIARAERDNEKIAVAFLDLDHFKDVNDTLGHHIGDALLKETAKRIKQSIRKNDIVARLGGDEFVIIMSNLKDFKGVEVVAEQLRKSISLPYYLFNEVVHSAVSIGLTIYPDDAVDIDDLLKNADQAMYGAKSLGRNNYHYFTQSMREQAIERMQLIQDLRRAIKNEEFFVVYQPIICLQTNVTYKAEALVRWLHPTRGIINPLDFIPLAEETGLIIDISDYVFSTVLLDVKEWRNSIHPHFQISINTSPIQYKENSGNIAAWMNALNSEKDSRDSIAFEITENLLMENKKGVADILTLVKQSGIPISIDDFGTGYSSLSYLKNYDTDYLKIDKSFVQKMSEDSKDLALCEAMVVMAKKLNIKVIAEGIETREQRDILRDIGCDYGQGYYFSRPIIKREFELFLLNNNPANELSALSKG